MLVGPAVGASGGPSAVLGVGLNHGGRSVGGKGAGTGGRRLQSTASRRSFRAGDTRLDDSEGIEAHSLSGGRVVGPARGGEAVAVVARRRRVGARRRRRRLTEQCRGRLAVSSIETKA